jgi:adenosylmethionine-8-amino-7-oxononanoate aminotransferase
MHVFYRNLRHSYPLAARGEGCYLYDTDGRRYLDASGGAAVAALGHGDAEVIAAIKAQLDHLSYVHDSFFSSAPLEDLAERLVRDAPPGMARAYFVSDGSEAVESALKLARQYYVERGEPQRATIIARRQSYHGNTLGALAAGGNPARRALYTPLLIDVAHIAPCYPYRDQLPGETPEAYGLRIADELEAAILRAGPETVLCFIAETVAGATLGAVPPVPGYFRRIREICDRYGVLLILDEVMCGSGRTGARYACMQEGVSPDLLCVAKGLGAGYLPIGALLISEQIVATMLGGSGAFAHGHTFNGHLAGCAAALAVQQVIDARGLIARVAELGPLLEQRLRARFADHPHVGDIRGRGLFWGVELVADRATKAPFAPERQVNGRVKRMGMERGLLCYPMGGTLDGRSGDHIVLAPPYIIEEPQLDELVELLGQAIDAAIGL